MSASAPPERDDSGDFPRVRSIFESALDRPPDQRGAFVEQACGGDTSLLEAVHQMLRADAEPHRLLDGGAMLAIDAWQPGDRFASQFVIVGLLGRGGMGDVYRAHDTALRRDIALKLLPSRIDGALDLDDRLLRFQREAQVLASLNHTNIAVIHGVAQTDGRQALVLELVEGPTLAEHIAAGPLAIEDVVAIARQIAAGLEAAHELGIVHRDLKPANIKVRPDGTVKLLDFGLAKAVQIEAGGPASVLSSPATITTPSRLQGGVVLGTAAYMSPEQAKGREADRRSDIWAYGVVLYEMLAGERPFKGGDIPETLAAVLRANVDMSPLPLATPDRLRHLVTRCLERDVTRRLRDIGEARIALDDLMAGGPDVAFSATAERSKSPIWRRVLPAATAAIASGLAMAAALWRPAPSPRASVTRFELTMPAEQAVVLDPQSRDLTISPDGTRVVYKGGPSADNTQLFTYALDELQPRPLIAPGLPKGPFVSPDGEWVGFFQPGSTRAGALVKKVAAAGGPALTVSNLDGPSRGATWVDNDTIIAASAAPATGLLRLSAAGGEPTVLTVPNREKGERDHWWPHVLPNGKAVLFTITPLDGGLNRARVAALDLTSGVWKTLVEGGSQAQYVSTGHLVYVAGGALWAISFDVERVETVGTAMPVVPQVVTLPTGTAEFDVARDGTLVYVARGGGSVLPRTRVWVDRDGRETPIEAEPRPYATVRLSPDETRIATEIEDLEQDIWVWDLARKTMTRVTTDPGQDESPVWTPDGQRLIFTSQADGALGSLFWKAADGSGMAERLIENPYIQRASAVLRDGPRVLFSQPTGLMTLTLDTQRSVIPLLSGEGNAVGGADAAVSPDGRWLAYVSIVSGSPQIYVSRLSDPAGPRTHVTPSGGSQPRWAGNGRELFYTAIDGSVMVVSVTPGQTFTPGTPIRVLDTRYYNARGTLSRGGTYDVTRDGQRFVMLKATGGLSQSTEPPTIVVVKNWGEELERLLPGRRR